MPLLHFCLGGLLGARSQYPRGYALCGHTLAALLLSGHRWTSAHMQVRACVRACGRFLPMYYSANSGKSAFLTYSVLIPGESCENNKQRRPRKPEFRFRTTSVASGAKFANSTGETPQPHMHVCRACVGLWSFFFVGRFHEFYCEGRQVCGYDYATRRGSPFLLSMVLELKPHH